MANDNKKADDNKGMNPLVAGAVGAVVGAVVGATAVELTKPEVQEKLGEIEKKGEKVFSDLKEKAEDLKDKI